MKKFLKITGITLVVILALLIVLPFAFQGKIVEKVKTAINENVNAKVDFGSFRISFIRNFPNVSFRMNELTVVGINNFEGDTLADVGRFFISVNIMSLFGDDGYEIKSIRIDDPRLLLKVLPDGSVNWDITKPTEEVAATPEEESGDFKLALKRFQINNAYIVYDDREMDFYTRLENFNHTLKGDMTADFTSLEIRDTSIESWFVDFDGVSYFNGAFVDFTADIDADLNAFAFTFRENNLRINDLQMAFDGTFAMPEDDMILDFTFSSPQTEFKAFLSLIPAIYAQDFEGLTTSGTLGLNGFVKGVYTDTEIPGFDVNFIVENGMFQYPDLPAAITDVFIRTNITNPGGDPDFTVVDVSQFSLNVAGNPVTFRMNLKTPVSDPQIDAALNGKIDLAQVKDFYPLEEGEAVSGIIQSDMVAKGRMSDIENERYDEFQFSGNLTIGGLNYRSIDFPDGVEISTADMSFAPQFAQLRSFRLKMGESDMSASGRIDNILGYALTDQKLTGRFETTSTFFDLNQFMSEETETTTDTIAMSVIEVPGNIDFTLQSRFDKILFDDLEITDATGAIRVADQTVSMNDLKMNMLSGTIILNGSYATKDITQPTIDFDLNISNFDIQQTFSTFNTFAVIAPIGERASGRFSAGFTLRGLLDDKLEPVLPSLAGGGKFSSSALTIENSPALVGLAEKLKMDRYKSLEVRDVNVSFEFRDGRVEVQPFDVNLGDAKATISGNHGFDQTINYLLSMAIPRSQFGGAANQALDNLVSQAAGRGLNITPSETVNIGVGFTGTVTDPNISLSLAKSGEDAREQIKAVIEDAVKEVVDEMKERADEVVDDAKEQVSAEAERRAAQLISEAEKQAENIRREAKTNADKMRKEARDQAKKLENDASGPIAKAAAKRAGEQLVKTADQNALKLEQEADQRATNAVNEARLRADKIRNGEE
jgi:hypothetical protein